MDATWCLSRRRLLASQWSVVTIAVLAGCVESGDEERPGGEGQDTADRTTEGGIDTPNPPSSDDSGTGGASDAGTTDRSGADDLDLRESNVVDVSFEGENGRYTFDVTLHHDDDGEDGYANWWQVERPDGTRLDRRELLHAHAQQPFTRSETIEIPEDVTCVVVRGHDQTHEYGGLAMVVDLDSRGTRPIDQDRRSNRSTQVTVPDSVDPAVVEDSSRAPDDGRIRLGERAGARSLTPADTAGTHPPPFAACIQRAVGIDRRAILDSAVE